MAPRERLDLALVRRGLFPSRQRAAAAVLAGQVLVDGAPASKPGQAVAEGSRLAAKVGPAFASRAGAKLAAALERFGVDASGRVCLDVGASTGGFTDCLLQRGAARVYAVDVGYGQLAWALRTDARVRVLERCNARFLTAEHVPEPVQLATLDVSFISLVKVLPAVIARMQSLGACDSIEPLIVPLIKPQFEAGPALVGRGGIVRDPAVHLGVLRRVLAECAALGWAAAGLMASPLRGQDGNREFLALLRRGAARPEADPEGMIASAVAEAWAEG